MPSQKFIVDAMLGKLTRWLRILGYDTYYSKDIEDWKIIKIAEETERIIITRDRGLCIKARKKGLECFMVFPDEDLVDILAKLSLKFKIDLNADPNFSRCTRCNGILERIDDNKWRCSKCGKEYWKGSHWRTIEEILIKARSKVKNNESRVTSSN